MHILRPSALVLVLMIAGLLSSACQSEPQVQATPAASTPAAPAVSSATPAATGPRQIPAPASGKAVVHGTILQIDTKKPLGEAEGVDVFLAQVIRSPEGVSMSSLDKTTAPRSDPDKDGVFVFADVAPGEYAVVVRNPLGEVVARSSADLTKDVVITVTAGQTLDLGEVYTRYP